MNSKNIWFFGLAAGIALGIIGQIKFDYAVTNPGANWGTVIGFTGIALAIGSIVYGFAGQSKHNK